MSKYKGWHTYRITTYFSWREEGILREILVRFSDLTWKQSEIHTILEDPKSPGNLVIIFRSVNNKFYPKEIQEDDLLRTLEEALDKFQDERPLFLQMNGLDIGDLPRGVMG